MANGIRPAPRFPCGKKKPAKTTMEKLTELARSEADAETALCRSQPHRRPFGDRSDSPLAESPLGRFVLIHRLRVEFYDGALHWASTRRRWISAQHGAGLLLEHGKSSGLDLPKELVDGWKAEALGCEQTMVQFGGPDGLLSVDRMAFRGEDFAPGASVICAKRALAAVAFYLGRIERQVFESIVS